MMLRALTADGLVPADDKAGHEAVSSIKDLRGTVPDDRNTTRTSKS